MFSEVRRRAKKAGQPPGTAVYTGTKGHIEPVVTVLTYHETDCTQKSSTRLEECLPENHPTGMTWVNVDGLRDVSLINKLAERFHLHPLTVEDILNVEQRPKVEEFDGYIFVTLKTLDWREKSLTTSAKQISLVFGKDFVLTFQEASSTLFDATRTRLQSTAAQRMREHGSDYLVYRLIDAVVDQYFVVFDSLSDQLEKLETRILDKPTPQIARTIYRLKRQMLVLRKAVWPMREAINHLLHEEDDLISKFTRIYLRDLYDHTIQAIDSIETFRDMLSGMLDMYLSSLTNRMNEIMKILTIITTIFIPITAIASIYGMNFVDIPGLSWEYGYATAITSMITVAIAMIIYFRIKKWI